MRQFWLAVVLLLGTEHGVALAQLPSTGDLFDRYARGDFAAFSVPRTPIDLDRFRQALVHDAEAWLRGDARTLRRRQLLVATIALEAAHASIDVSWAQGRQLVEWATTLLRKGPADEAERRWHLAALSVIQGAHDHELLAEQQKLAWPRFQDDPHLLLALVVLIENSTWPDPDRNEPWNDDDAALENAFETEATRRSARQPMQRELRDKSLEYQRRRRMRQAIEALEDLSNAESVRAEALLRLGYLHLRLRRPEIAAEQFDEVLELTKEPFLVYLAHFLGGTVHEEQGDRANAAAAYRAALAVIPRAQSASIALATLLFIGEDRDEAARLIDEAIRVPVAPDPWRTYQSGDFRFWNERLAALREALK